MEKSSSALVKVGRDTRSGSADSWNLPESLIVRDAHLRIAQFSLRIESI